MPNLNESSGPLGPPVAPAEIVIYCEGFGAGPGCGWFVEVTFLSLNEGGYSVFRHSDGTVDDEDDELSWENPRSRRIATLEGPLDWRSALRFAGRMNCLRLGAKDASDIQISGAQPLEEAAMTHCLTRGGGARSLISFLCKLSDQDLQALHEQFGGLNSSKARKLLPALAGAARSAKLRKPSLQKIARLVGIEHPWDLELLAEGFRSAATRSKRR